MARTPAAFKQTDIVRAVKAARAAGLDVIRTEINPATGAIILVHHNDGPAPAETPFDEWKAKRNARAAQGY